MKLVESHYPGDDNQVVRLRQPGDALQPFLETWTNRHWIWGQCVEQR